MSAVADIDARRAAAGAEGAGASAKSGAYVGLAGKISLVTGLIGLVTVVVVAVYMYRGSLEVLTQRDSQRLTGQVALSASRLEERIDVFRRDTLMLARTAPVTGIFQARDDRGAGPLDGSREAICRNRLERIFEGMLEARPEYAQIRYVGRGDYGREIVRVDRLEDGAILRVAQADLRAAAVRYHTRAIALDRGQVLLSEIEPQGENGQARSPDRPVIRTATPVFSETGETLGVIVITIDMRRVIDRLSAAMPDAVPFFVTDQDGAYLAAPAGPTTFGSGPGPGDTLQETFPPLAPIFGTESDRLSKIVDTQSGRFVAVARRVHYDPSDPTRFLVIAQIEPNAILAEDIRAIRNEAIAFAGIVLLAGILGMLWQIDRLVRPLSKISRQAMAVGRGDCPVELAAIGPQRDEIGALAQSFDEMVGQVAAREKGLAARAMELEDSNAKLGRSNDELSQFAYIASHDLQEPLRMVDSYMGLIERRYKGKLDADADEFIGFAVDGARRMKRMINDLLAYSRVANRPLAPGPVDTQAVVQSVVQMLQPKIDEAGGTVAFEGLPTIRADAGQLERLFTNLIGNAIKFRGDAPPTVTIAAIRKGEAYEFTVADNGIGIAEEYRERVFEVFARLHSRGEYDGTGIGLAACQKIVELHRGRIWIEPNSGGGTVFHVLLPVA